MLSVVAALVLGQGDNTAIDPAGGTSVATAKGDNPATDTFPGSVPPDYVLTDAGIDTTCTDIDFLDADVTVSNLGGTDHCCNWCDGKASSGYLCCPTVAATGGGMDIVKVPTDVTNARQILEKDYMMYNTCHGSPDAALGTASSTTNTDPVIKPHEGSTSYIKLSGVQVDATAPPINLIIKNTTQYIPAWPILGDCYLFSTNADGSKNKDCAPLPEGTMQKGKDVGGKVPGNCKSHQLDIPTDCEKGNDFLRNHASGGTLKPAGYLNNGRKTGPIVAGDLLQVNLCEERFLNLKTSFVDDDDKDVTLMQSTFRFFDIDHGHAAFAGPEVMQFKCPGGTFTLYGEERDNDADVPDLEFLMHISDDAKAGHRPDDYGKTPNGLGIHVYDCPGDKYVTLWSSRFGVGKDNPTSSVIEAGSEFGKEQERSMVQIDMYNINEFEVAFAVVGQEYQDGWTEKTKCATDKKCKACSKACPIDAQMNNCKDACMVTFPQTGKGVVGQADKEKLARLQKGLQLTKANYPEMIDDEACPYDVSGRNWLFAGMKGLSEKSCPPPAPPPSSPPPGCADTTCKNGFYGGYGAIPGGPPECLPCDAACDSCTGPSKDECMDCPMSCPQAPTDGKCANGQYSMGVECMDCDSSCISGTVGPAGLAQGDSCTGPDAGDCTKCPYLCDPTCDKESSPSYAEWGLGDSSGKFKCLPCDPSCTSCTGPDADQCTTCNEECDVSQCKHGQYPHGSECKDCDPSCEFCTGPGANECATCPKSCEISDCKNGEYLMGTKCEKCDASCTASGQGYGESCVGPEAGDCVKCPYECDVSCAAYADKIGQPMYADWSLGNLDCQPCASECGKSAEIDGASCTGPSKDECTTCFPPKACALSQCANGEYAIGTKCEKCDASCTKSGQGYGESCTGPGARDCVKCPYECDDTCSGSGIAGSGQYANWIAPNGVYFSPECKMCSTECVGNGDADKTGAGCTGPSKDECTTCISPPPPSPPADPPPLPPADPPPSPPMDPAPSAPAVPETTTCGKTADFPNYEAACGMGDYQDSTGSCEPCDPCCEWGGGCSGGSPGTADCTSCFYKGGPPPATATCDKSCPAKCKEQGLDCGILPACTGCALAFTTVMAAAAADCVIAAAPDAPPSPPALPMPGAQIFDDPHVRTLSGNQFFMHGVGVFDYASIPNVISTQVYMCPFAPCTADMMEMGDCLTFIQAVAVKIEKGHANGHGANEHVVVWRNNAMRIDGDDRKAESNITLGGQSSIRASGRGSATAHPDRVQHESLADCHVLSTKGQPDVLSTPAKDGQRLKASEPYPRQYIEQRAEVDVPMQKGKAGWAWADSGVPLSKGEKQANEKAGSAVPQGGVWAECTNNEWTLSTKQMTIDVGVIGPFEKGYLREAVSDRTFNLNVLNVADKDALQGIINGDKNGLFKVMEDLNPPTGGPVDENVGALVPKGPHGAVQEVTAANVAPDKVLFSTSTMREMDRACGEQQSLRAIRLDKEGEPSVDVKMWKDFKRRSVD